MADVFVQSEARSLLKNKKVLYLGDSNIRAQYKDMIWLLNYNTLICEKSLKAKLEPSFEGDELVERSKLYRGRDYKENRVYYDQANKMKLEFFFLTRCFNQRVEKLFDEFKSGQRKIPDVIVINSCLWDLTRWGPKGVSEYKDNMVKLMRLMSQTLPKQCLVIWCTALPTGPHVRGGLLIKQIQFMDKMLRFEVMEANTFAREVVVGHGFDVLDNHYYTQMQMHRRAKDGVHYLPVPVRFMTNLLLTHIALTWDIKLPKRVNTILLDKAILMDRKPTVTQEVKIPTSGLFSKIRLVSPVATRTRGLSVTISENNGRQCNIFANESPEAHPSRIRSVVQLPQNNEPPHAAAGPYRRNMNKKKKRRENHPYQHPSYYNPYPNTPSFYNPYANETSAHCNDGGYYHPNGYYDTYGNDFDDQDHYGDEYYYGN